MAELSMTRDPTGLPLWIALVPLAVYLLALAVVHVRRRALVVPGSWDLAVLVGSLAGLAIGGPLAAFLPPAAEGLWRWLLPAGALVLLTAAAALAARPRLIVYNMSGERLRPVVAEVAAALDPESRWAGETVALPGRELQVHLETGGIRSVSLVAVGSRTSPEAWSEFGRRVRRALTAVPVRPSPWAWLFAAAAAVVLAVAGWLALRPMRQDRVALTPPLPAVSSSTVSATAASSGARHAGPRRSLSA
jgi:hypothetical protein